MPVLFAFNIVFYYKHLALFSPVQDGGWGEIIVE